MITDKEALLALLDRFGLTPNKSAEEYMTETGQESKENTVYLVAEDKGVDGYGGMYVVFSFDEEDRFKGAGIWE